MNDSLCMCERYRIPTGERFTFRDFRQSESHSLFSCRFWYQGNDIGDTMDETSSLSDMWRLGSDTRGSLPPHLLRMRTQVEGQDGGLAKGQAL
jgi:hypothetical protein